MLFPVAPARFPKTPVFGTSADAETLAWFGTAYGRRVQKPKPLDPPPPAQAALTNSPGAAGAAIPGIIEFSKTKASSRLALRPKAPPVMLVVVLGAVLIALLVLRTSPVPPPPALAPIEDPSTVEPAPQIEASQPSVPDAPAQYAPVEAPSRAEAERLARAASEEAERLAAAAPEIQEPPNVQDTKKPVDAPAPQPTQAPGTNPAAPLDSPVTKLAGIDPATPPPAALPPLVPIEPAAQALVEARLAPAPAPAISPEPQSLAATEEEAPAGVQSSPLVKANLPTPQRPTGPSINLPGHRPRNYASHSDLAAGQAHFAKGDLPAARAAFAKAFEKGLPEAGFALGNTFDPVSLAKAGVKSKGDPDAARRWYRRAFELAMRRPGRRGQ